LCFCLLPELRGFQSVAIVLPATDAEKAAGAGKAAVALYYNGNAVAIMKNVRC